MGGGRWVLLVLFFCGALLAMAPVAVAADTTSISGTVTEAGTHTPLSQVGVRAYQIGGENEVYETFFPTNAKGEYKLESLPAGEYRVEFYVHPETQNFLDRYWDDSPTYAGATPVKVNEGEDLPNINAELKPGGVIEGEVTEAGAGRELEEISIAAISESGGEPYFGFALTAHGGHYKIQGLPTGRYEVYFYPESEQNLVPQYWDDALTAAAATLVEVEAGKTASPAIDAALEVGGEVSGTVTDATTHAGLAHITVIAYSSSGEAVGYGETNANGEYTLRGLATGSYKIKFEDEGEVSKYITQYYNDELSLASAGLVNVVQKQRTSGIDAALVPKAPFNTAVPVASGTPIAGQTLSCSTGSWTGSPAPTYTYAWLRDGVAIPSATAGTYAVQSADIGNGLTCKVTATNKNGSAAAVSNTLIVSVPPATAPTPKPEVNLLSTKLSAFGATVRVPLACANANCAGTIELTKRTAVERRRGHRTLVKTLILGRASYSLTASHTATIAVHLTATGIRVLAGGHRERRVPVTIVVSVTGGPTVQRSVVVRPPLMTSGKLTAHKRHR